MTRRLAVGSAVLAAGIIALLAGCTGTATDATTSAPASSSTATAAPVPTATPAPTADAAPAATCDTVLAAEGYAKLTDDGLEPRPASAYDPLAVRMIEAGGLACAWGKPQTDIILTVVQVRVTPADEAQWVTALAETGYVQSDDPVPAAFTGPVDGGTGGSPAAVLANGTLTYVSAPVFAGMLAPAS